MAGLESAVAVMHKEIEDNTACLTPPISANDRDALQTRLDNLLSQLGDGIDGSNFMDYIEDLDSTAWAQLDSAALNTLAQDMQAQRESAGCEGKDAELREKANEIFREYADLIRSLGTDEFATLVNRTIVGYATGECEDRCEGRFRNDVNIASGIWVASIIACATVTAAAGPFGPFVAAACTTAAVAVYHGTCNNAVDRSVRLYGCLSD